MDSFRLFFQDVWQAPALLIAGMALLGLWAQKKSAADMLAGTVKTVLGFIVLAGGAGLLLAALAPLNHLFQYAFSAQGVVPNNEAVVSIALNALAAPVVPIMALGMLVNIGIARFTRLKYIFLTGHHAFYMACLISVVLTAAGLHGALRIGVGALWLGLAMALFPALAQPYMRRITGGDDMALGHFGTVGYVLAGAVGQACGKGSPSTETLNVPKNLSLLRDSAVSISLTMMVIYVTVALAAGADVVQNHLSGGQHYLIYATLQAITFAAGVFIVLQGVRLVLAEIIPAFTGFAERWAPDAKPALDCPIVYPFAPNAVFIGFLASFSGGLIALALLGLLNWTLILPGVAPHFFCGATAGVFGNATGGRRGALLGAFAHGLLITFLPVALLPTLGELGSLNTTFSDSDFAIIAIALNQLVTHTSPAFVAFATLALLAGLIAYHRLAPVKPKTEE